MIRCPALPQEALIGEELLGLSLMVLLGKVLGDVAERAGLSRLVGEIAGGAVLGPFALGGVLDSLLRAKVFYLGSEVIFLSQLSVVLLVYASGLEHGSTPLRRAGGWGVLGAVFGALVPFLASLSFVRLGLANLVQSLFIGAAIAPTSLAVVSHLLQRQPNRKVIEFLLSASAIDDVVSLVILTVALGAAELRSSPSPITVFRVAAFYSAAWIIIYFVSLRLVPTLVDMAGRRYLVEASLAVLFGLIAVMQALGFSPIVAAFIAGVSLAESAGSAVLRELSRSLLLIFGSIFFVVVGAEVNFGAVGLAGLAVSLLIFAIALASKAIGVIPFAYAYTRELRLTTSIAMGMEARGEVGLAIASIGLAEGALGQGTYGSLVVAILLTTVAGAALFARSCPSR
ncbi:MAG: cation:proton antiporter [Acidilobus sp.]